MFNTWIKNYKNERKFYITPIQAEDGLFGFSYSKERYLEFGKGFLDPKDFNLELCDPPSIKDLKRKMIMIIFLYWGL